MERGLKTAGVIAIVLLAIVAIFQLALALGAPLGSLAWGGRHESVLPVRLRLASAAAGVIVYPLIVVVVLDASELLELDVPVGNDSVAMWVLTAFFAIGTFANAASRSRKERYWAPVSLAIAVCCGVIAAAL